MGTEYGFYMVDRYKGVSLEEFFNVSDYITWKNNPWNFEEGHYPTYEAYWKTFHQLHKEKKFPGIPSNDIVEYYESHRADEFDVAKCIGYWRSGGAELDKYITNRLDMKPTEMNKQVTDKSFIEDALIYCEKELDKNKLISLTMPNNVGELELEDDYGNRVKLNMNNYKIWVESKYYDPDERYVLKVFRDALYSMKECNFDNSLIWYSRSW